MPASHSIAILDDYQSVAKTLADWSPLAHIPTTTFEHAIPAGDLVNTLEPFTIIHAMRERTKLPRDLLVKLPNLRFITTTGSRNRGIDLEAAKELGIIVSGTTAPGTGSTGTVEQTWALILALSRRLGPEEQSVRSGGWQTGIATGLAGKTLGLVGVGRLGKAVALVGKAFSMRVIAWSPHLDQKRADEAGVELSPSLEALLSTADVVSLHLVLAASTTNLLNATNLALLKPSAFLINTSRGPLINEASLVDLVTSGKIRGVGLDVFDVEPLPSNHPLRTAKNVALSPHMGYVDDGNYQAWFPQTVENIVGFLGGKPLRLLEP